MRRFWETLERSFSRVNTHTHTCKHRTRSQGEAAIDDSSGSEKVSGTEVEAGEATAAAVVEVEVLST